MSTPCVFTPNKPGHESREAAQRAAQAMNNRNRGHRTSVYRCACGCGQYRLTHGGARTRHQPRRGRTRRRH